MIKRAHQDAAPWATGQNLERVRERSALDGFARTDGRGQIPGAGFDCDAEPRKSASGRGRGTLGALAVPRSGSTAQTVEEAA